MRCWPLATVAPWRTTRSWPHESALLEDVADVTEKRMFGGLAFLIGGNMSVALGQGGMLVRVSKQDRPTLLLEPGAQPAVMGSREMSGWIEVDEQILAEDGPLAEWVARGRRVAESLPPK